MYIHPLKTKINRFIRFSFTSSAFLILFTLLTLHPQKLESANLTSASDTLQTSRLSYHAQLASGHSAGDTVIQIDTGASTPNTSTTGLMAGDTVTIGSNTYTIQDIVDSDEFTITSGLTSGDETAGNDIYYKAYSRHDIDFTSTTSVTDGAIRIYIEAPDTTSSSNDGNPDGGSNAGYDLNSLTGSNITCPTPGSSSITFATPTATRSGDTASGGVDGWHTFECPFSGTLQANDTLSNLYIGDSTGTSRLINPAPDDSHSIGTADTYKVKIEVLDSMANNRRAIDTVQLSTALIEAVRVTATVDPTISMTICGADTCNDVEPGDTVDGETLSSNSGATSTSTSVALGTLSLSAARLQAQKITISTNASSGYSLTALDDGNLRKGSDDIDDVVTPPTSPAVLNTPGTEAYGIHPSGSNVNTTTWGSGGASANKYSGTDTSTAVTLASTTGPTAATATYVTYKANISATTAQGTYSHIITYIATGTF